MQPTGGIPLLWPAQSAHPPRFCSAFLPCGRLQGQAALNTKIAFRPASLNSRFHKKLTAAVEKRHTKTFKVRRTATVVDPNKEKAEREKAEEARIRSREGLQRRQVGFGV